MKKFTYLISLFCLLSFSAMAEESVTIDTLVLCNAETIKNISEGYGAPFQIIANPDKSGINTTDSVIQVGRTTANWWEYFNLKIDTTIAGTESHFEMMINYPTQPDIAFRVSNYYRSKPGELYDAANANTWQVVRFDVTALTGETINLIRLYPDMPYENSSKQLVLSPTTFGYIDEIKLITKTVTAPATIDAELCNFESIETAVPAFGATVSRILNPQKDVNNGSDSCLQVGRSSANWYELIDIAIDGFMVPTSDKCFVHVKVKSSDTLDISLRPNKDGSPEIRANNPYNGGDKWQDLVFDLGAHKDPGFKMTNIRLLTDVQKVLDNTSTFAYFDEIIVNEDSVPRIIPATLDTTISTFEEAGYDWAASQGATITKVENTDNLGSSLNNTDSCLKVGDDKSTYYALMDYTTTLVVPASDCYLHVMVKSNVSPNLQLRTMPDNGTNIAPESALVNNDKWQDLVYNIGANKFSGYQITGLRFMIDYENNQVNITDSAIYIDEVIIDANSTPRTNTVTHIQTSKTSGVKLYPNPTSKQLFITGEDVCSASLFSISGQQVLRTETLENGIDVSRLNKGIYIVECNDSQGNTIAVERIIKK